MARPKKTVVAPKWPKEACSRKSNNEEEHGASSKHQQTMESKICKPICLSSDNKIPEADDHGLQEVRATKKRSNPARSFYNCSACGKEMFSVSEIHEHPTLLGVGICSVCFDFLCSGPFTKDKIDGVEEQCRWCGQGGTVVLCNHCEKVFCETCIVRNFGGRNGLLPILDDNNWRCFCCNPEALCVKEFRNWVSSGFRNETRASSCADASDVNLETRGEGASSIADRIMARSKQKERRNQNNGIRTTSRNKNSREKSRTSHKPCRKRAGTSDREHSREVKRQKPIEEQQAPSATPPTKTHIRPHQVDASEGKGKETTFINSESHANENKAPECAFDKTPRNGNLLAKFTEVSHKGRDCVSELPENSAAHCVHAKMVKFLKETSKGLKNLNKLMDQHTASQV